ncbi:MAG: tripartite tricarboxylate transporter substrate binding protein [Comamonas sp.]
MTSRRTFLAKAAAAGASPWILPAQAQSPLPGKVVKIIVPFQPGGAPDMMARLIGTELGKLWSQSVIVENRAGAGGSIGTEFVARAPADGATLLLNGIATHGINPALYKNLSYDPVRDFTPLTMIGTLANVLLAGKNFPANNLQQLIDLARAHPGMYSYSSVGNGTSPHLCGELLCQMAGIKLTHVPYKGSAAALNDILGGQVPLGFDNLTTGLPFIKDGKVKALAVTTKARSPLLPNVPTLEESGVPGYDLTAWAGIVAPANLPPALAQKISADIGTILRKPAVAQQLLTLGVSASPNTPAEFAGFISTEISKFRALAHKANLQMG